MLEKQIIEAARAYLGVPFRHQGRNRLGLDCLGLLVCVAQDCRLSHQGATLASHDEVHYGHYPDAANLQAKLQAILQPVQHATLGCAALIMHDGAARHLGIIADYAGTQDFSLIHAYAPARKVVEHRLDAQWQARIVNYYQFIQS